MSIAKLLTKRTHQVPGKLKISEYFFEVPLNHANPPDGTLRLFARSIERFEKPVGVVKDEAKELPWLLYLQGGPGFPCKSPQNYGWTEKALNKGYQIMFLDQRGTGLSSTVTEQTLARHGGPMAQAMYLRHFRADSIAFILGGLAPIMVEQPDPVYQNLYYKVAERNRSYYAKYSEDIQRVKNIIHYLQTEKVRLPSGGTLSIARFRQLGINLGFHGGIDAVHEIILRLDSDLEYYGYFTRPTLAGFESTQGFDDNPLYALMHEAIYLQG
ncbi:MAG: hypothetical protein L6R38_000781 [Xanthoria sp. 2 TBL-2021]|nr:MAG: hypothetical protein L6R38_000781 [Xanthoria sp. 2 TBL-2021]